jgi:glycosyltransferase involved in cell wall biosynthesis
MVAARNKRLCLVTRIPGVAGPASFQRRLAFGLAKRNVDVSFDLADLPYDAILVTGASRRVFSLRRVRRSGCRIIQRVDGINWIHRRKWTGLRHYLRAEVNNRLLHWTRENLADVVVYQSQFVRKWWEAEYGLARIPSTVIHNGVPLDLYSPGTVRLGPSDVHKILVVEGNLAGGYEVGLDAAVQLVEGLKQLRGFHAQLEIAGRIPERGRVALEKKWGTGVRWLGVVAPERTPEVYRSAHLLYSADIHPACPNSVLEALACGLPVVAFDTGSLAELVAPPAGLVVPYGSDPWRLEPPDVAGLVQAAAEILEHEDEYRPGARRRAETMFGLDRMVDSYLSVLGWA